MDTAGEHTFEAEYQYFYARLLTDSAFRKDFFDFPDRHPQIPSEYINQLLNDRTAVERAAKGLIFKRLGQVKMIFRFSYERYTQVFSALFQRYAGKKSLQTAARYHQKDALQFALFLLNRPKELTPEEAKVLIILTKSVCNEAFQLAWKELKYAGNWHQRMLLLKYLFLFR